MAQLKQRNVFGLERMWNSRKVYVSIIVLKALYFIPQAFFERSHAVCIFTGL